MESLPPLFSLQGDRASPHRRYHSNPQLRIGDNVATGLGRFSEVFWFTHKNAEAWTFFVLLETHSGEKLKISGGHYLYVNGHVLAAKNVKVGDVLDYGKIVSRISSEAGNGLYNPHTLDADIIVDGIRTSTFTTAFHPMLGHMFLSPLRWIHVCIGFVPGGESLMHLVLYLHSLDLTNLWESMLPASGSSYSTTSHFASLTAAT